VVHAVDFAQQNGDFSGRTMGHTQVLRCPTIEASMDRDCQLERYSISDVKPVELLMEQLTEPSVVFTSVAGDVRGSIEHSL